jgi:hypothetical protein
MTEYTIHPTKKNRKKKLFMGDALNFIQDEIHPITNISQGPLAAKVLAKSDGCG